MDTSAWYAAIDEADPKHDEAVRIWDDLESGAVPLVTTEWVFVETVALLQRRKGRDIARSRGRSILQGDVHVAPMGSGMLARVWERYERASGKVSLVDCGSFEVMGSIGIKDAFAFDQDFTDAGFNLIRPKQE